MFARLFLLFFLGICFAQNAPIVLAATGINDQISFQGKVVNTNGTNVANGSYDFVFKLYTVSSAGTAVWTETWNSGTSQVTVTDGIFQVNLGTHTDLPGSIDFNTDNIYLGIEFNGDGEMSPRVHFTAAPYAFNAMKVAGLTVTDTTGTLTIPNGEIISFGGSFTTTASNDVTLTTSGATNVTLPTTGTLATLAGSEILTNKTIGSTGLTFSGATTDITTASGEDLTVTAAGAGVIVLSDSVTSGALTISGVTTDITTGTNESLVVVANGTGVIDLQDATTVDSLTTDTGGVSIAASQSYTGAGAVTVSSATGANALTLDSGSTGNVNLGTGNNAKTIAIGTGTAGNTINVGTDNTTSDTINIGSVLDNVAITGDQWSITNAGVLTVVSCTGCGGGSLTIRESDTSPSVASTTTFEFGPASNSSEEFIVTDQTGGVARVVAGTMIGKLNEAETVTAGWTFNTAATTFTTAINANGGLTTTTADQNLAFSANGNGDFVFSVDSGTIVSLTGGADGTAALTLAAGDFTLTDGDLIVTAGDANFTLDAGDALNVTKTGANTGDVMNIAASSVNAIDGFQVDLTSTADSGADTYQGINFTWTESADADTWTAINLPNTTSTNSTTQGLVIGTGYDTGISVASGGISTNTLTSSGAIAANGGITFDAATDTVGAFTANGTINMNANILENIGNTGTDFIASTGALTLAGVLTANGGVTIVTGALAVNSDSITSDGTLTINASGTVDIDDILNANSITSDAGVSIAAGQSYTGAGAVTVSSGGAAALTLDSASGTITTQTDDDIVPTLGAGDADLGASGTRWDNVFGTVGNFTSLTVNGTSDPYVDEAGDTMTGALAIDPTITGTFLDFVLETQWTAGDLINADWGSAVTQTAALTGLNLDFTNLTSVAGSTTYGLLINDLAAQTSSTEYAFYQEGTNWDFGLYVEDAAHFNTTVNVVSTLDARGDVLDTTGNLTLNDAVDISGALAVSGISLTAISATTITLGSTGADTITIGNGGADTITIGNAASTGVSIVDDNWSVTTAGVGTFITGTVIGSQTFTTNNIADSGALTIASGSGTALTLNSGTTGTINIGTDASAETINIGNTGAAAKIIAIGNNTQANTITIGDSSVTSLSITENNWSISTTGAASFASATISGALAANGGITFDASTDTVGAFTAAGTIDMNTNILTNIGNSGTDFVASTGALTLAGVLTANGGITLASSQTFTASSLSYMDLGAITHGTTAVQGLRLPQAASASPSSPVSGEGYLAWDAGGNQVIYYNGSAWATFGAGGGYATIKDETTSLTQRTTLAFLGAGVSCADNVTQTECTISGGAGSDLQGTYGADVDGGNATISLTSADDGLVFTNPTSAGTDSAFLLQLTQQNTTAGVVVLDMVQSSNAANGASLVANAIDTETGLVITANGLTSGKGISITSSPMAFTGNLADVQLTGSNAANTGNVLAVSNTGTANANTSLFVDHRATGTGNLAMRVDDEASDTTPFIIDGAGRVGIATASISEDASTERLLQVGSETNRGNSVTYGEVVTKGQRDITALANIRDVFVYDTTMDSDGGRWIDWATTDKLSWYTEILDDGPSDPCDIANDDRCYKAAFPRKAILVVTTDALYVFDAQDNTMWMKFSQNASGYALGVDTSNDPSSVTALNGVIYVGTNGASAGGLYAIDFTTDRMWKYDSTDRSQGDVGIGSRNSAVTYNSDNNTNFDLGNDTGWDAVNDVSGAVMQFSTTGITIGAATNLAPNNGTTLIAIATDSGLGVINLSRQRYLAYSDTTDDNYNAVAISRTGKLYGLNNTLDQAEKWINIDQDQVSEENGTPDKVWDQASTPALSRVTPSVATGAPDALEVVERGSLADGGLLSTATVPGSSDLIYVGTDQGLAEIHDHSTAGSGWSKFYTTTQQTSLMPGTIKRAHMMEDVSGDLTDSSFRANTMAPIGGITYGINGVRGKGVTLNGTSGFFCSDNGGATCAADTDDNMSTTAWNIQMWFKHSTTQAGNDVLYSRCYTTTPAAASACVTIYMTSTGTMVGALDDDATWTAYSSYDQMATSTRTYNDNQWHHVVLARDNANDVNMYIDGTPLNLSTATGSTLTLDASQLVAIGADCSVGAACATGANFWDGSIDDFTFSQGTTTVDALTTSQARRLYNDARPLVNRKVITVTDATTVTSTTIGDSGETWLPNEFVGQVMEITGGTGAGQTRRVISNTTTTLTVSPAFSTTPDTTSDFEINPEVLYGAVNGVTAIGITAESPLGEARQLCVGTNNGSDGGGVTCLNHQAGPNIVADVYHGDSEQTDDSGTEWTGTDYDDIQSIDISGRAFVMGTMAHFWTETEDVRLGQGMDYMSNKISDLTNHIKNLGMQTLAGSGSIEIGLTGGADLAERYYSSELLQAGEVVAIDSALEAGVKKTTSRYQRDTLGIVATQPGLILGPDAENGYPIALVGRVPVKVTFENGPIYAGDRITSASRPGFAMRATQAGRVIGQALSDAGDWEVCPGEESTLEYPRLCTSVLVYVNLSDYYGQSVELAMAEKTDSVGLTTPEVTDETGLGADGAVVKLATTEATREERIMQFLKEVRDEKARYTDQSSEVFTDRVAASTEIITPKLVVDEIFAKSIKADSIEGLSLWTDRIASLQAKYAGLVPETGNADANPAEAVLGTERTLLNLEQFVVGMFTTRLDASILGKLSVTGALTVADAAEFQGETTFARLATFMNEALFRGKVAFEKTPTFSADTAGFATITEGEKRVRITFDEAYARQPIVTVTLTRDISPLLEDSADDTLRSDVAEVEREYVKGVFDANIRYIVTEKDQTGFTILLSDKAPADLSFSWVAIAVDRPRTSVSQSEGDQDKKSQGEDEIVLPETPVTPAGEVAPSTEPIVSPVEETPILTPAEESVVATPESETI